MHNSIAEAKLIEEDQQIIKERLSTNCQKLGFGFRDATPKDGNCFFHAISDQLHHLEISCIDHKVLRQDVVEYIKNRMEKDVCISNFIV